MIISRVKLSIFGMSSVLCTNFHLETVLFFYFHKPTKSHTFDLSNNNFHSLMFSKYVFFLLSLFLASSSVSNEMMVQIDAKNNEPTNLLLPPYAHICTFICNTL